ncbi:MAG: amidase [Myxococcota bacterium]|nr:amidase [Myxococcota bacterium]
MAFRPPSPEEIETITRDLGLQPTRDEAAALEAVAGGLLAGSAALDAAPDELPAVRYPRTPGRRPPPEENPLGAWYVRARVEGADEGPLRGRSVALKDNVMLAGVPLANGTRILEGYVPPVDATVVTRILDAGGTILGKAVCESFCLSGGSHTSDTGPVRNPHEPTRSAGGSSSGSAALVAAGEVDLAIGGDQGGSIRVPSSYCGTVGMKATHGLVPYTGILGIEATIDHVGPITANVADNALLLEVIAGPDGLDGRQAAPRVEPYTAALGQGAEGLRIGVLEEGFGQPGSEAGVDEAVRAAAQRLAGLGAKVSSVSVPLHRAAPALLVPIFQSSLATLLHTDGTGPGREDVYVPSLVDHLRGWRQRPDDLPITVKAALVATEVMRRRWGWRYYAKAMNQVRRVRAAYDAAFVEVDVLLMPTTPHTAPPLPAPDASPSEVIARAFTGTANTQPFDHTHHPALSLPCGRSDGLPVGAMLVGRAYEEATLYRAAGALERGASWREL